MNSFKILPHTADLRLKLTGETSEELFKQAILGLSDILKPGGCATFNVAQGAATTYDVVVKAPNETILLIDFLSEVLTASYEKRAVFCKVEFLMSETKFPTRLKAKVFGRKVDGFDKDIKAVTYHEAKIIRNKKGKLETIIVFDI